MSWTKENTYGLFDRFQTLMVQEPYKFRQIDSEYNDYSRAIWIQNERDELNRSIKTVFDEIRQWIGFYPRPIWKEIKIPLDDYSIYFAQEYSSVPESAWLNDLGVRSVELIESEAEYVKSGDFALFTITTTEISDGEVCFFHKSEDAFGNTADERFRVYPDNIYYSDGSYNVKIHYSKLIYPEKWLTEYVDGDPQNRKEYDKNDGINFSTSLDVYRVYNDSTVQAKVIGAPFDFTTSTVLQEQNVNVVILDEEEAIFKIQETGSIATFEPTHLVLNAYIGYPLTSQNYMNPTLEEFILRRAKVDMGLNAKLSEAKISEQWQYDYLPAYTKANTNSAFGGVGFVPNPIGARNVDVEMFKKLLPISNWRGKISDQRFWIGA